MNVLSSVLLIRDRHFSWCPTERTLVARDCHRCQGQLYAFAVVLAALVAALEFFGSRETGSRSLWSDAWHVASDGFGYLIGGAYALLALYQVWKPQDLVRLRKWCETAIGMLLVVVAINIFGESGYRLWFGVLPDIRRDGLLLGIAVLGLLANLFLLMLFWAFGVHHDHGGAAGHHHQHGAGPDKILQGNFWHTASDTASSFLVIANAVIFSLTTNPAWGYLDLSVSIIIAGVLFWQGVVILSRE